MEEETNACIALARQLCASGSYSKAFDMYFTAFEEFPTCRARVEPEFRALMTALNEFLGYANRIEDVFNNFVRALKAYPENKYILNDIGKYLYKFGFYTEAWCHFQKALKLDSGFVNAEKNLNSVKNLLVERWHFRMLNDKMRNEAYRAAIRQTVIPNQDSILDLGTGTGLLAMYAHECKPTSITGCDGSDVMTTLAEEIIQENGMWEIFIVNNMSTDMTYIDVGGRRSVLVTELFDAGLLGEHILQAIYHARLQLMTSFAKVIPNKAEFFVIGAKCDSLCHNYQLNSNSKKLLNITGLNVHVTTNNETYDCEDVHLFKNIEYISEPQSVLKVDFNDHSDVVDKLNRERPYYVNLKATEDGEINIVVGWFNLYLTDKITITTDPRSEERASAWQQAVFYDNIPETVKKDQPIELQFLINGGKLTLLPNFSGPVHRICPDTIRFLNDSDYINMINKCIGTACVYLGQIVNMSQLSIVDLCPFPYFGLLMLRRGAQSLTCCVKTESEMSFFKEVFSMNDIPLSRITMLLGDEWNQEIFRDEKFHAVFTNMFVVCGDVDLRLKKISQHLRTAHLVPGGLYMPSNVKMVGQLVSCPWLDATNRVCDKNVSNYKVAKYINKYQVSQNFCIDLSRLEYTALTEPAVVARRNDGTHSEVVNVHVINSGHANAILCWYEIEVMEHLEEITTNRSDSFIDGMAFMASPQVALVRGETANILRCIDSDGSFKLIIDVEAP